VWLANQETPVPSELTAWNSNEVPVRSAVSPDGSYLAYTDRSGIHLMVVSKQRESNVLKAPPAMAMGRVVGSWHEHDSTRLVVQTAPTEEVCLGVRFTTWVVSENLADFNGVNAESISPDGQWISPQHLVNR
jgi:hypothetical protein